MPNLVLLDIHIPRVNGFEVLEWIRLQSNFRLIPVIMFSSSDEKSDIVRAYELHANSYLVKPSDAARWDHIVTSLHQYWFTANSALNLH